MVQPPRSSASSIASSGSTETDESARLVGSDRVLAVLVELARHPDGVSLEDLARKVRSPKPTVHRALAALRRSGLADQDHRAHYVLGDEFLRMAFAHHEARPDQVRVRPLLDALARRFGETAHYAALDGTGVVYRAKVDPPLGAVKLTSTIGGRNPAHATAVGKLLLSYQIETLDDLLEWIGDSSLERRTPQTRCEPRELFEDIVQARRAGYAVDDQENEPGVNCIALPAFLNSPTTPSGAVSVSALTYRTPLPQLIDAAAEMSSMISAAGAGGDPRAAAG